MKFMCDKETFAKKIFNANDFKNAKSSISITSNVYLKTTQDQLIIKATDNNMGYISYLPVITIEEGEAIVSCTKLGDILKAFSNIENIILETENDVLNISPKDSKKHFNFELKTNSIEEFPNLETPDNKDFFKINALSFLDMIKQTQFAASKDESRHYLCGQFFQKIEGGIAMVATDGKRLSFIKSRCEDNVPNFPSVTIPTKFISIISKIIEETGEIEIALEKNLISIRLSDETFLYSSLIEVGFPVYNRIIPQEQKYKCLLNLKDTIDAINRVKLFVLDKSNRIFLNISQNKLTLTSDITEQGQASEDLDCDYNGEEIKIAVNYNFFLDPLKNMDVDYFSINFDGPNKTLKLLPESNEKSYLHIVMPIQPK
ncbi:MAG: DNA polymerase III subunit beta [Pleomorphochaeta sp.]